MTLLTFAKDPASRDHREPSRSLVACGKESARYYAKVISASLGRSTYGLTRVHCPSSSASKVSDMGSILRAIGAGQGWSCPKLNSCFSAVTPPKFPSASLKHRLVELGFGQELLQPGGEHCPVKRARPKEEAASKVGVQGLEPRWMSGAAKKASARSLNPAPLDPRSSTWISEKARRA